MSKFKIEAKWALIFTGAILIWMILEKVAGLHDKHLGYHYYLTNLFFIPAIWILVFALKDKKENFFNGEMSYLQGLISGIIITTIITVLSPFTQWIISYVITPDYFANVIEYSLETGYHSTREEAEAFFNFRSYVIGSIMTWLVMGISTTAIAMIFIRTKSKEYNHAK